MTDDVAREICRFYSAFPQWFDASTEVVRGSNDVSFYRDEALRVAGRTCELGAGTGRVLLPIARAGVSIDGVELAEPMLALLRERLEREPEAVRQRVRLIRGDMRDGVAGPYELMTCPFRGFQHLVNLDDQRRALRGVRRALSAGGTFLFDLFYPSLELLRAPPRRVESVAHRDPQSGELAARFDSLAIDRRRQLLRVEMRWERQRSGLPAERLSQVSVSLRWFELPELELLLDDCDLRIVDVYGDFDGAPFDADSSELIVRCAPVARRPEREP